MELSLPYSFTGLDGSRFVVGNSDVAKADPDYVGLLDPAGGITGLLDGAEPRAAVQPIPLGDGVSIGRTFRGARDGTVQGVINPHASLAAAEGILIPKIQRVMYAAEQSDAIMRWTPSYDGRTRRLRVRHIAGRPDIRGRMPKTFMLALASPDPFILGDELQSLEFATGNHVAAGSNFLPVTNYGTVPAEQWFRVDGPADLGALRMRWVNFQNPSNGFIELNAATALTEGEYLLIYPHRRVVLRGAKNVDTFEADLEGWAGNAGSGETLTRTNAIAAHGGSYSLSVAVAAGGQYRGAHRTYGAKPGRSYQLSAWLRGAAGGERVIMVSGNPINAVAVEKKITLSTVWTRHQITLTATRAGNPSISVIRDDTFGTGAMTFYVDDAYTDNDPVDASGLLYAGSLDNGGPWKVMPGTQNVQWDAAGTTGRTPLAQMFWRSTWP